MGDPLKNFGVFGPMKWVPSTGSHLNILESISYFGGPVSRIPPRHFGVLDPGSRSLTCRRPGSRVSIFGYAN